MENQSGSVKFAAWMASPAGRIARVVIGAALVVVGVLVGGAVGVIVGLVGLVPVGLECRTAASPPMRSGLRSMAKTPLILSSRE
jgi:hypothetical protein